MAITGSPANTSPKSLWPSGTLNLRQPRLAQSRQNLAPKMKPVRVGPIKPIRPAFKPLKAGSARMVPLSSLLRPRRMGF
ncbi:MAG TPA: hypothetical protein VKY85_07655 [Candidatus Angelobacter sp.]|nr:hypothetical protein [Candidatus Angelobacter sp.]